MAAFKKTFKIIILAYQALDAKIQRKNKISTFICQTQDATCPILVHNRGFEGIYFIA